MYVDSAACRPVPHFVREDRDFYVPDHLSGRRAGAGDSWQDVHAAADDHARDLRRAEQCLEDAVNLAGTLRAALAGTGDTRSMQADTVLRFVENLLNEAHAAIDRHDTRFMNLFMAYFDLKGGSSASLEN